MTSYNPTIKQFMDRYRCGDHDAAFFGLLEQDKEILPPLIEAYKSESQVHIRRFLVKVIWQHRDVSIVPFLGEVLGDESPEVWKEALDGLVALASPMAKLVLCDVITRFHYRWDMQTWLSEALEQVDAELKECQ